MSRLKKELALVLIVVLILTISATALAETGVFNTRAVNLRVEPSLSSDSKGLVSQGTTCDILDESGSWLKVYITSHTKNDTDLFGETGWAMAKYIDRSGGSGSGSGEGSGGNKTYDDIASIGSITNGTVKLNSGYVYVRALPSQSSAQIGQLYNGDSVKYYNGKLTSIGSDSYMWYKLTSPYKGFVATNYIVAGEENPMICPNCKVKMGGVKYQNITRGGFYKSSQQGNNYYMYYHATAEKVYYCVNHPENTCSAGTVSGYIREDNPNYFYSVAPV